MDCKPLMGLRVLEFTHAVMGPSCGMILADLGAEVIAVEAVSGNPTRNLKGFGCGYFPYFNRNKKSLALNLKDPKGLSIAHELCKQVDIVVENFAPGTMTRLNLDYPKIAQINPKVIYCSMKGFLSGPYEKRIAMDEVVQMMGGLAYMTGPKGRPLRAGSSVVDITGGLFAAIGILSAVNNRHTTGRGCEVKSGLFETTAFLMGQHLAWSNICKKPIPPMPERVSAWAVYQIFKTKDQDLFIGIISEKQWTSFCQAFNRQDLLDNPLFSSNNLRIDHQDQLIPQISTMLRSYPSKQIMKLCEKAAVPFAPISRPEDLFLDPHLNEGGFLEETTFPSGIKGKLPLLPIEMDGAKLSNNQDPPKIGEHGYYILEQLLGLDRLQINELLATNVVSIPEKELKRV